ncbi:DSBA oxidoreductase [Kocuria marina]|uniref:DSBA oxidoreductase n=1 Tax=Kocuria marina TaxID=223184 RepID=A0A0B0D971_9MICC|nr:thioredoxin domain-containing protein [Kocuria marina]KHE73923.1 DSBA oxidoreductase [Kocuria marina]
MSTTASPPTPKQKPSKAKIIVWVLLVAVVAAVAIPILIARANSTPETVPQGQGQVVRENSRVLSQAPDEQAVLVEFLDYECEGCRAAYPVIEELRAEYADTVTFVHRYFPLPGHRNSMNAALAVEAAAQQGQYEAMYQRMFETQEQWGESAEDQSAVFRGFAKDLGLDMAAFDAAVADPATQERIELDVADGEALGVGGTPTFFLDGEVLNPESLEGFRDAVETAATD